MDLLHRLIRCLLAYFNGNATKEETARRLQDLLSEPE